MKRNLELLLVLLVFGVAALAFQKHATAIAMKQKRDVLKQQAEDLNRTLITLKGIVERLREENSEEERLLEEASVELIRLEKEEKALRRRVGDAKTVKRAVDGLREELKKTEESLERVGEKE